VVTQRERDLEHDEHDDDEFEERRTVLAASGISGKPGRRPYLWAPMLEAVLVLAAAVAVAFRPRRASLAELA
jgi:hypothetical protein